MTRASTLGELKASGWVSRPVKEEVRTNAIARIAEGKQLVDGVIGYEDTVLPQLENALIAGHDVIFLGERGQAKTRMIRWLTELLDEWMPIVSGSEINDDPYNPVSHHARMLVAETAATSPPAAPASRSASRTQAAMARQPASTSKSWPPGAPGGSRCAHSRCAAPTCRPASVNSSARQLPVPASIASK